jgi:hypothetical protein
MSEQPYVMSKGQRKTGAIAIAIAAAVLGATFFWIVPSAHARGNVRAVPRSMHCGAHHVPYRLIAEDGDVPTPAFDVTLRPKSFCQVEITIVNDGSRSVHVSTATFPTMGQTGSGFPLEITQNGGRFNVKDTGSNDSGDAVLPIDETIGPGESTDLRFDLRTRKSGFLGQPGRIITVMKLPRLRVSSGGLRSTIDGTVNIRIQEKK